MAREKALRLGTACFTALVLLAVSVFASHAAVKETVDYVFPDPNTPLGEPDPAVWASTGSLSPQPSALGLQITDPDDNAELLYFFGHTELANPANIASFHVRSRSQALADASSAWSNDAIGFRLILDDSRRRVILTQGRDPVTKARQLVVLDAAVSPIPFPWDNGFHNLYEIGRLPNGDFTIIATNNDPNATGEPVTVVVPGAALPASTGSAMLAWGMGAEGGGVCFWQEVHGQIESVRVDIGLDTRRLDLDLGEAEIKWRGEINLPAGVTLNPPTEPVTIKLANASEIVFEFSIPVGGFQPKSLRKFRFETPPGSTPGMKMDLRQKEDSIWNFHVWVERFVPGVTDRTMITGTISFADKVGTQSMPLTDKGDKLVYKRDQREDSDRELTIGSPSVPDVRSNVLRLLPSSPNPFREGTVLALELGVASDVTIEIFDVAGRRLFVDRLGPKARGINQHFFGGRDQGGRLLRSGVYFARVSAASAVRTQRLVIVR